MVAPPPSPADVADEFFSLYHLLKKHVDTAMTRSGVPLQRSKMLALLDQENPCRSADLATWLGTAPRTVTQGVVNYTVQIQLDPAKAQGIRPGMTATATIVTASKDNAVLVPNRAIKTQGRAKTVQVLDEQGKTQTLPVQIGMANDQVTEITGGLQPGARVVIPTTTTAAARVPGLGGPGGPGGGAVFVGRGG